MSIYTLTPFLLNFSFFIKAEDPKCGQRGHRGGGEGLQFKILGGEAVVLGDFPWVSSFNFKDDEGNFTCTASILSPRFVITAAHCTHMDANVMNGLIRVETIDNMHGGTVVKVKNMIPHEKYDFENEDSPHHIALLKLETPVSYNENIDPICLPKKFGEEVGNKATAAGFGATTDEHVDGKTKGPKNTKLFKVNVEFQKAEHCIGDAQKKSGVHLNDTTWQLYAGSFKKGTAEGDSGGPLMAQIKTRFSTGKEKALFYLIGITSLGIYTRVSYYCPWIEEKTSGKVKCI